MSTNFPGAIDSYSTKVDGVTQVLAAHINDPQDAIVAIEEELSARNANLLYHSLTHDIWQEGITFADITDDSYVADVWNFLHNGQAPDVVGNPGGSTDDFARQLAVTTDSNDTQFGIVQFLQNKDTIPLRGKTVSMSAEVRSVGGPTVTHIRMNVIVWTGTADSLTSDVVGTWGAGNPTLATNWAYIGTPADLTVTASKTTVVVEGLTIPTNANNIGFFVWTPDLEATASIFSIQNCQLKLGIKAGTFKARSFGEELARVQRFLDKSYDLGTSPGTATATSSINYNTRVAIAGSVGGTLRPGAIRWNIPMRTTPTVTFYSTSSGASGAVRNVTASTDRTGATAGGASERGVTNISISNASANAIAADDVIQFHYVADARL